MWLLKALFALIVAVPLALAATIGLWPLWNWIEERFAIEAVGHAMPAGWCFLVTYAALAIASHALFARPARKELGSRFDR